MWKKYETNERKFEILVLRNATQILSLLSAISRASHNEIYNTHKRYKIPTPLVAIVLRSAARRRRVFFFFFKYSLYIDKKK